MVPVIEIRTDPMSTPSPTQRGGWRCIRVKNEVFRGVTYFRRAFVCDGELTLLLAVVDVAQLVVEQIRGRRRRRREEPREKHREQGRETAHPAAEPERLEVGGRGDQEERRRRRGALSPFVVWMLLRVPSAPPICATLTASSPAHTHAHSRTHTVQCIYVAVMTLVKHPLQI